VRGATLDRQGITPKARVVSVKSFAGSRMEMGLASRISCRAASAIFAKRLNAFTRRRNLHCTPMSLLTSRGGSD
jgi:hypothetical protein